MVSFKVHPDRNVDPTGNHESFVRVNEAYTILIKPETRQMYDVTLRNHKFQSQAWTGVESNIPYGQVQ